MPHSHEYVVFDVGSTLIDFTEPGPFRRFLQDMQPQRRVTAAEGKALLERWNDTFRRRRHEARGKGAQTQELDRFWFSVVDEICAPLPNPQQAVVELRARFDRGDLQQLHKDVRPTLAALRQRGVPMGIISNFRPDLEDYLKRLRIRHYFRFVICSSVVGLAKPDRHIFDLGVQMAGVLGERILYVGDDPSDDVAGAQTAGLAPVLIDRTGQFPDVPCRHVSDLRELLALV
jgi:HAD superfamily hydrolase (TIGR01549 family)